MCCNINEDMLKEVIVNIGIERIDIQEGVMMKILKVLK